MAAFEAHGHGAEIQQFFQTYCLAEDGLAAVWNLCVYSDEPEQYGAGTVTIVASAPAR